MYLRYVIWTNSFGGFATLLDITESNVVSLDGQFLKLDFKQQGWMFLAVYIEYFMSLISGSDIERFL